MYLVIGLGNPEPEYSHTRHNMGFDTINILAEKFDIKVNKQKFNSIYGTGIVGGKKVVLIKPQTYMNLSGEAVREFKNFYKPELENVIVIYDDIDIETGTIKIRKKGGPGNHNGMKSVVYELGTEEFARIRIGTGNNDKIPNLMNYVIDKVSDEEYTVLEKGVEKAAEAVKEILELGIDSAMNKLN